MKGKVNSLLSLPIYGNQKRVRGEQDERCEQRWMMFLSHPSQAGNAHITFEDRQSQVLSLLTSQTCGCLWESTLNNAYFSQFLGSFHKILFLVIIFESFCNGRNLRSGVLQMRRMN